MAHAQKPNFVFRRNGRVNLNRRGRQFSRLLAADVCASAVVIPDTPRFEVVWRVLTTHSIRQFLLHSPPSPFVTLYHRISAGIYRALNMTAAVICSGSYSGECLSGSSSKCHPVFVSRSRSLTWVNLVTCTGEKFNAYGVLVWKAEGKRQFASSRRRWKDIFMREP